MFNDGAMEFTGVGLGYSLGALENTNATNFVCRIGMPKPLETFPVARVGHRSIGRYDLVDGVDVLKPLEALLHRMER